VPGATSNWHGPRASALNDLSVENRGIGGNLQSWVKIGVGVGGATSGNLVDDLTLGRELLPASLLDHTLRAARNGHRAKPMGFYC
jgi:hypothetical protein